MNQLLFKLDESCNARNARRTWAGLALSVLVLAVLAPAPAAAATDAPHVAARVEEAAREALEEQADREGWLDPQFDIDVVTTGKPVEACADALDVQPTDTRYPSRMRFSAVCSGAAPWRRDFTVRAKITAEVVVAATQIAAGKPIAAADVMRARRTITGTLDAMGDMDAAVGLSSKRALRSGDTLRKGMLASSVLVKRGDSVRIVAKREQIEVTMAGEALDAGAQGEVVRVRNTSTGKVIRARVTAAGAVEPADL